MEGVRHVRIGADRDGQRLDNLLLAELRGVPRSLVYRLIRQGQVRVNGGRAKPRQRLNEGDEVRVPPVRTGERGAAPTFSQEQQRELLARIVLEDDDFIVVDKPAGMAVHAGSGVSWGLIDLLRAARRGEAMIELVHRLDRETSGCLLLAKTRPGLLAAQAALGAPEAEKRYLCLVAGDVAGGNFTVDAPLRKNVERGGERLVVVDDAQGRDAVTRFEVLERFGAWTLLAARLETGRTHQIRVHAAHAGYPVAGDPRYGIAARPPELRRLFLHCVLLQLPIGVDGTLTANAPLPDELGRVLDALAAARSAARPSG